MLLAGTTSLSSCSPRGAGTLHLAVTLDGEPVPAIDVALLPYDPEGVVDSLSRAAPVPRPTFPSLESEVLRFEPSDQSALETILTDWQRARAGVDALADTLSRMDRESPRYERTYERFRSMYDQLLLDERGHERRFRELAAVDQDLAQRATTAADSLRGWETHHLASFDAVVERILAETGLSEHQALVEDGEVTLQTPAGRWWMVARLRHPENPFTEYVWNVPVTVNRLVPVRAVLGDHNVRLRWRY